MALALHLLSIVTFSLTSSSVQSDFEALLIRMRQRQYPETIPVLASYWLKTICVAGHNRAWWKRLNHLMKKVLREPSFSVPSRDALTDIQNWIEQSGVLTHDTPDAPPPRLEPFRPNPRSEWLGPYIARLLNEWLPAEVAHMLVNDSDSIPLSNASSVLAAGKALERLLVREHLTPQTLEMLLQPELFSPWYIYPAHAEMLRDVVLFLLGRTCSPPLPVMPATLLGVVAGSALPPDFRNAVRHASLSQRQGREEIRVPIAAAQGREILRRAPMRIASIIVTSDGRWWESETLQSGEQYSVLYTPGGRLCIDFSAEHARLALPWPDSPRIWPGPVQLPETFEIFGREWRASSWETDGERTWLHVVFSRVLPIAEIEPAADSGLRRSHPAAVDIAWTALGDALAAAIGQKSLEPIEQLRRTDFVPLGRAIFMLAESLRHFRLRRSETLETQFRGIRFLQAQVSPTYGRVPWRILPSQVRAVLMRKRTDPALRDIVNQVFEPLPERVVTTAGNASPSQAA